MWSGRPKPDLVVADTERETLEGWTRLPTTAQGLAVRARIVLRGAAGETNAMVAERLRVSNPMVGK